MVQFKVRHLLTKTSGVFRDFGGTIEFDEKNRRGKLEDFWIAVASIDTRNEKRDNHLRSADFFDATQFHDLF